MAHSIPIVQETRRWDGEALETASMRSKENAHDYRYFPEPDLVPVALSEEQIAETIISFIEQGKDVRG